MFRTHPAKSRTRPTRKSVRTGGRASCVPILSLTSLLLRKILVQSESWGGRFEEWASTSAATPCVVGYAPTPQLAKLATSIRRGRSPIPLHCPFPHPQANALMLRGRPGWAKLDPKLDGGALRLTNLPPATPFAWLACDSPSPHVPRPARQPS